jgi:hypothetical protein
MDKFEILINKNEYIKWPNGGGFQPITIKINNISLIEIIKKIEKPFVDKENKARIKDGRKPIKAGKYLGLNSKHVLWPSKALLGEPWDAGFILEDDDPIKNKSMILICTCGDSGCWPLLVDIIVDNKKVIWKNFCQFHRDWVYNLGPFYFDKGKYKKELKKYHNNEKKTNN